MKIKLILVGCLFLLFVHAQIVHAQNIPIQIDSALSTFNIDQAKKIIDNSINANSKDFEFLWRCARVYSVCGDNSTKKEEQENFYRTAIKYADEAVKIDPSKDQGYIRRAVAKGKLALFLGVFDAAELVNAVKKDAEKGLEIATTTNNTLNRALGNYLLGRSHLKLSEKPAFLRTLIGLGWGNLDEAIKYLNLAVKLRPDFIMYRLDYARALLEIKNYKDAERELKSIQLLPIQEFGDEGRKKDAEQIIKDNLK